MRSGTKFTKELLQEQADRCKTMKEFMVAVGSSITSMSARNHVKKKCESYGISLSHFVRQLPGTTVYNKKEYNDILVYDRRNGLRERPSVLRRALKESGVKEVCECGQGTEWNGKKLVLEMDHKDGDCLNNRPGNVRFICPNCHSQVEIDYKKNKGVL